MKKVLNLLVTISFIIVLIFVSFGCGEHKHLKIALSKGSGSSSYPYYYKWLRRYDKDLDIVDLFAMTRDSALKVLKTCDGLVLTGGADINPGRYNKEYDTARCEIENIRDTLEFALIKEAENLKMPVLGVCRGLQLLNVAFGGTLIVDIPSDYGKSVIHELPNPDSCFHSVNISENSLLYKIFGKKDAVVNSNHHQGIAQLSDSFKVTARTPDNLPEAIEWKNPDNKPFLLAIQWHPERLDSNSMMPKVIAEEFLKEVKKFEKK